MLQNTTERKSTSFADHARIGIGQTNLADAEEPGAEEHDADQPDDPADAAPAPVADQPDDQADTDPLEGSFDVGYRRASIHPKRYRHVS